MWHEVFLRCLVMSQFLSLSAFSLDLQDVHRSAFCKSLGCANNATCRTTMTNNEIEGSHVTYSECLCRGHWIGPKCDHHLSLKLLGHEGPTALLKTDVIFVDTKSRGSENQPETRQTKRTKIKFNVQYWSNDTGSMCNIMTRVRSKRFQIKGMKPEQFYTVCVSAEGVDLCFVKRQTEIDLMPNCVTIRTVSHNTSLEVVEEEVPKVVAPLSLTIFFVIVTVVIVVILVKCRRAQYCKKNNQPLGRLLSSVPKCKCPCLSSVSTETRIEPRTDSWLLPKTANGRFRNYSKRTHPHPTGIPLTTIIEYKTEEAETSESPLMLTDDPKPTEEKT